MADTTDSVSPSVSSEGCVTQTVLPPAKASDDDKQTAPDISTSSPDAETNKIMKRQIEHPAVNSNSMVVKKKMKKSHGINRSNSMNNSSLMSFVRVQRLRQLAKQNSSSATCSGSGGGFLSRNRKLSWRKNTESVLEPLNLSDTMVVSTNSCSKTGLKLKDEKFGRVNCRDSVSRTHRKTDVVTWEENPTEWVQYIAEKYDIQTDPTKWSAQEVQQWFNVIVRQYYTQHLRTLTVDGALLCILNKEQIQKRIPDFTDYLVKHLEIWKSEGNKASTSPLVSSSVSSASPSATDKSNPLKEQQNEDKKNNNDIKTSYERSVSMIPNISENVDNHIKRSLSNFEEKSDGRKLKETEDKNDATNSDFERMDSLESPGELMIDENPLERKVQQNITSSTASSSASEMKETMETDERSAQKLQSDEEKEREIIEASDNKGEMCVNEVINEERNERDPKENLPTSTSTITCSQTVSQKTNSPTEQNQPIDFSRKFTPRRKSETNERLRGISKNLKLKIRPPSPKKNNSKLAAAVSQSLPFSSYDRNIQSAPVLATAYNKGYQDAQKLRDLIRKSKDNPSLAMQLPFALASANQSGDVPKILVNSPTVCSPVNPIGGFQWGPLTPQTPPILTPMLKGEGQGFMCSSPVVQSPIIPPVLVKQEQETFDNIDSQKSQSSYLKVPQKTVFRTPSPPRTQQGTRMIPYSPLSSSSPTAPFMKRTSISPLGGFKSMNGGHAVIPEEHDPETPLDLSSDKKSLASESPIILPSSGIPHLSSSSIGCGSSIPDPCYTVPFPLLSNLPRSISMPSGDGKPDTPTQIHGAKTSKEGSSLLMIHPNAYLGGVTTIAPESSTGLQRQGSNTSSPEAASGSYSSMSSIEGDSDHNEMDTPSANYGLSGLPFPPSQPYGQQSSGHINSAPVTTSSTGHYGRLGRIKLWEFLLELLSDKTQSCITWVSREQGIFKILNSEQVASLWGARKGLSNMNYDKLSRSIRQYYKQDIIKKTVDSKRLVYQFDRKLIEVHKSKRYNVLLAENKGNNG